MKAEILAVGTEILLGDIVNTNAQYLSKELALLGVDIYYQGVVGDNPERLKKSISEAFSYADLLITTGGLGPTKDDLTKEVAAEFFGEELSIDKRALEQIEDFFNKTGRSMTENNRKQAMVPVNNCTVLYNDNGTAPGILIEKNNKIMFLLPGPPKEMVPMFEKWVRPYLSGKQEYTFVSKVLRVANIGESKMEDMIKDLIDSQTNPTIAPYAKDGEAILRITAKAKTILEAEKLIEPMIGLLKERLGKAVYAEGETSIQDEVVKLLIKNNKTIAVAESCTGGEITSLLIEYPGVSDCLIEGVVTYSNESKVKRLGVRMETIEEYSSVSEEVAKEMALGVAYTSGADIGLATTGVAGPGSDERGNPQGLVYIGLCVNGISEVKKYNFAGDRNKIRYRASYVALDWLRRVLENENQK